MRKGEFDLTGKAVDCSGLPALDDAGKEIFRALKVALGFDVGVFNEINVYPFLTSSPNGINYTSRPDMHNNKIIQPSDVLPQAAIDAAMDGATLVFAGDKIPYGEKVYYKPNGGKFNGSGSYTYTPCKSGSIKFVGYKLLEEKPDVRLAKAMRGLSEDTKFLENYDKASARVLAEKVGAKPFNQYDDLRDAHLELIRENMEKDKEIELLKQRIKDIHRAMNDAKAALDV